MKPLCIDLFCGLGGWTEGFLAEGWDVIGFDIEQHVYGEHRYPAQLVLQDVLTLHGRQLREARCIVASSPCQAYSYMAMPWSRAKQIARALRGQDEFPEKYDGYRTIAALNELFEAPKRIQREACEAAGRFIPMIQENVRGAIPWVGRSQWNFGSFHFWGNVPALMPTAKPRAKVGGMGWYPPDDPRHQVGACFNPAGQGQGFTEGRKNKGGTSVPEGMKNVHFGSYADRKAKGDTLSLTSSKSPARKAASAAIAKIPAPLARHIAQVYYPLSAGRSAQPHD